MSVMKYKDPTTGEVKKVGAPKVDTYTKTETDTLLQKKADLGADGKVPAEQVDAYSKSESISAETRTALSLAETATPDAALAEIARQLSESGGISMDLLWENADISSTFPAQTLTMDLSKYKAVYICSVIINSVWDGTRGSGGSCVVRVGDASGLIGVCTWNGGLNSRFVHVTSSGITFGSGGYVNCSSDVRSSDHEGEAMPYKIYGIL